MGYAIRYSNTVAEINDCKQSTPPCMFSWVFLGFSFHFPFKPSFVSTFLQVPECHKAGINFLIEANDLIVELDQLQVVGNLLRVFALFEDSSQDLLTENNVTVPTTPRKRRKIDSSADIGCNVETFVGATEDVVAMEESYVLHRCALIVTINLASLHPYLLQTLSKWSAKVQAVAPSALLPTNRGAFLKGKHQQSAVQLINENLLETTKLLERTRVVRAKGERLGRPLQIEAETETPDPEIFDDTDFYQKLLQAIIDSRGGGVKDEGWKLLQKQKKEKKKVDNKASKGRKLR